MRICEVRRMANGRPISTSSLSRIARFLQHMAILHPYVRPAGISVKRSPVEIGGDIPLPRIARAVRARNDGRFARPRTFRPSINNSHAPAELPELTQFTRGIVQGRVEHQRLLIRGFRFRNLALELQNM